MHKLVTLILCSVLSIAVSRGPLSAQESSVAPQAQSELRKWLVIDWSLGQDLPQGFQDSDGGILGSQLITCCGFCSGGLEEDNRRKPGRYPRGFLTKTWALDLDQKSAPWTPLADFPGAARQGLFSAVVGEALYFWGGFSYTEPYCHADGYRLARNDKGSWNWDRLPDLPGPITSAAVCVVGSKIYLLGGADYDGVTGFFTEHDRAGARPRMGAQFLVIDTERHDAWQSLPECPGTPRFVHAFQRVGNQLFVIGGATGDVVRDGQHFGTCTVVDNWRFDLETMQWSRLRDLPVSSGNFPKSSNLVWQDRFIVLPGGHQYGHVANPDGSVRDPYGRASRRREASGLHNDVFVYDTVSNQFGTGDPLPIDNNLPMSVIRQDRLYLIGGETGGGEIDGKYYGHHPDLLLIGTLHLSDSAPN